MTDRAVQIKVLFTNYESAYILQYLLSYIEQVKRHYPHLNFQCPSLTRNLPLLQFKPKTNGQILAYDLFVFNIEMIQSFAPQPRIYFTGALQN